ncbi:hypothetical protein H6P81_010413 [Aristolochia fimbriata]|uniref:Uncharacterized protein n=1 Tax=Aristolochia fimbriata TaxID=158543 RepID=A0AAV7ENX4_ARIFI|nr:hypothetical protein H6P81_010413 [Aristolochia fimbriata]
MATAAALFSLSKPSFLAVPLPSSRKLNSKCLAVSTRSNLRINAVTKTWEPSKVVPQGDRVLVRLEELPQQSAGGVLLPKSAVKFERYLVGEVLAVGAEAGGVETGKKVLLSDISAYEVDLGTDAKHCFCKAGDLLAVVE